MAQEPGVEKRIERVDRQLEALENEKGGFVERSGRAMAEGETGGEKAADRITKPVARGEERFDPLVALRVRQGRRRARRRRSYAALALVQEVLARFALQALGVGLLGAFDRLGGPLGGVLSARREETDAPRRICSPRRTAAHAPPLVGSAPAASEGEDRFRREEGERAQRKASVGIRIRSGIPVFNYGSSRPRGQL